MIVARRGKGESSGRQHHPSAFWYGRCEPGAGGEDLFSSSQHIGFVMALIDWQADEMSGHPSGDGMKHRVAH